jgi:carbon-monoxide dehydrogenase medium subunit
MMRPFAYYRPKSVQEACRILAQEPEAYLLAGGTDLLVHIKRRQKKPTAVVNLKAIPGLSEIRVEDSQIRIGALATQAKVVVHPVLRAEYPVLPYTVYFMGSPAIRNLATIGGNLCNASPAADLPPVFLVLDAEVTIAGAQRTRRLPLHDFFLGPGETALMPGEILTEVSFPRRPGWLIRYERLDVRQAMDIAIAAAGLAVRMNGGRCVEARVALGAVAPTPIRVPEAEAALAGQALKDETIGSVAGMARDAAQPISDIRASAEYRRHMVEMLVRRGLIGIRDGLPFT